MVYPGLGELMGDRKSWLVQSKKEKISLDLGDGQEWIEVKDRLTVGEERDLADRAMGDARPDLDHPDNAFAMVIEQRMANYSIFRVLAWLTDWSLVDHDGKPIPVKLEHVRALELEAFNCIDKALDEHISKLEAAKAPANPTESKPENSEPAVQPGSKDVMPLSAVSSSRS